MSSEELKKILELHALWLSDNGGERADLRDADLRQADLQRADLRDVDLRWANLRWADLQRADLRDADLRDADLDFSCFPLWCGGSRFKCDLKLVYQLLAHICTLDFDDTEGIKELVLPFAIKSHRAKDLGLIGDEKARGEGMDENVRSHIGSVITLDELGIDVEVMDITGEVDAVY